MHDCENQANKHRKNYDTRWYAHNAQLCPVCKVVNIHEWHLTEFMLQAPDFFLGGHSLRTGVLRLSHTSIIHWWPWFMISVPWRSTQAQPVRYAKGRGVTSSPEAKTAECSGPVPGPDPRRLFARWPGPAPWPLHCVEIANLRVKYNHSESFRYFTVFSLADST